MSITVQRRLPIGAEPSERGVHFRVWAQSRNRLEVVIDESRRVVLEPEGNGYFSGWAEFANPGMRYGFCLDGSDRLFPDPASRYQPDGPHGLSQIVNTSEYRWTDEAWRGARIQGQVIYEMHIGTFTPEGTWKAARQFLPQLVETGITLLEVMPVSDFPGKFGWGYDGVNLFAPTRLYGTPSDFQGFVDYAHSLGLGVILDVVYNHFGPDGNYLTQFSPSYFTNRYDNEWGQAINFDGDHCAPVREFFITNARYWIDEFHLDGLRLDATQQVFDSSPDHILYAISREARLAAGRRSIVLIGENEAQSAQLASPPEIGGYDLDALWNDDFHHIARVALTGHTEAYYSDYHGSPQEFISSMRWGFLYQGQYFSWQRKRRGTFALNLTGPTFVSYIENHDQIANSSTGSRPHLLAAAGKYRAITALLLLGPHTPMLFQGQEYGASTPFLFFSDHNEELAGLTEKGRGEFLAQFPSIARAQSQFLMGLPRDRNTFERCKLDRNEMHRNMHWVALHKDLLSLRRNDPVFRAQRADQIFGAVLGPQAFVLRFFGEPHGDRLMLVNLGPDLRLESVPEPLLAPPRHGQWEWLWSSEDTQYGGSGTPPVEQSGTWNLPGHSLVVMYESTIDN